MPTLSDLGERALVDLLIAAFDEGADVGLGDDAAYLRVGPGYLLLATDVVNEATHVPAGATGEQVGWYAVAVNFSDIAAMGGEPFGFLAALTLPRTLDLAFVEELARGVQACVKHYGARVLGGDTKEGPALSVAGTAVGRTRGEALLRRTGCRPGDLLAVTGALGRGGWAEARLGRADHDPDPVDVLLRPHPRVAEGLALAAAGTVTTCMDISDGLAASLAQLHQANGVAFRVDLEAVPVDPLLRDAPEPERREAVLYHGGDFELLFTARPDGWEAVEEAVREAGGRATVVGEVVEGGENRLVVEGREEVLETWGYEHFTQRTGAGNPI